MAWEEAVPQAGDGDSESLYSVLQCPIVATQDELRASFRRLALQLHPDRAGAASTRRFQAVQEAFKVLADPDQRACYDKTLVAQLDMQMYLDRFRDLVLTVQGLQLPPLRPHLHPARRQQQAQQQQRQGGAQRCTAAGHAARQVHAAPPRPPMLTFA